MTNSKKTHDPKEYVGALRHLLISDKKKIAFLFGAGTSCPHIPAVDEMTAQIEESLKEDSKIIKAIEEITVEIESDNGKYNIETLLSNLEQKHQIIGKGMLNNLSKGKIQELIKKLKSEINKRVNVEAKSLIHADFAAWIGRANRKHPVEIFTTNYDYLFEIGLEQKNIPFYDGFTGSLKPFFHAASIEDMSFIPNQTKLWKIHGSLGWHYDEETKKIYRKESEQDVLIYPSTLKYTESKKQPYIALMDRLTNFLKQSDTILIVCGYSFGDEHVNERIVTALNNSSSGHVIALYFDKTGEGEKTKYLLNDESDIAAKLAKSNKKISVYGHRSAVIGGQLGEWKLKQEPDNEDTIDVNIYFDEDAPIGPDAETIQDDNKWAGKGNFILPDFEKFVEFLTSMIIEDSSLG